MTLSLADIERARVTIAPHVHRTPLLTSRSLSERIGAHAYLKAESLQRTGSFKVRGAVNAIAALTPEQRANGIVTMSAGNHAQAVAYAAAALGVPVFVAMPETAPATKVAATRGYGAEVRFAPDTTKLMPIVEEMRATRGLFFLHPFDDDLVMAGQGTVALEVLEDLHDADVVVVPVGGGGLISGIATALAERRSSARAYGVEPEGAQAVRRGLEAGKSVRLDSVSTIADALAAPFAGERCLEIIRRLVADVVALSDDQIVSGMRLVWERARLVVEPGGAAAVAALLGGRIPVRQGERVVAVLSGGNVDLGRAAELLATA